jgi:23S rRNA (cytosine1962-C5)-methyltransferase
MRDRWPDYELIDFGEGRKLERFAKYIFDRPCPTAADVKKAKPAEWSRRNTRYDAERVGGGQWVPNLGEGNFGELVHNKCQVPIKSGFCLIALPRTTGQVGVFPEQFANWQWIAGQVERAGPPIDVLNLFAYSGGSTLAAVMAGARVTHVDASKQAIEQASGNALFSGLEEPPIRWIIDDAMKFCRREVKRKRRYDAVILDPPSYGHGPKGEEWNIKRDLLPLLELCGELTERRPKFVLVTCHTPGIGQADLAAYVSEGIFSSCGQPPKTGELYLETAEGRRLPSGVFARWPG